MIAGTGIDASGIVGGYSDSRQMTGFHSSFVVSGFCRSAIFSVFLSRIGSRGCANSRAVRGAGGDPAHFFENFKKSRVISIRSGKVFVRP
ncbi:hypothetical protein [Burkholderia territorii]|uniref:hypothetical protein n=1 Tax=Burkholderia territorii TaxID=1503055 RepID=UPI000B2B4E60|nr:hypothetical protein [Burkholderia territorii]